MVIGASKCGKRIRSHKATVLGQYKITICLVNIKFTNYVCPWIYIYNSSQYEVFNYHNDVRDLVAKLLSEVCHDVQVELTFLPLTGERMGHRTAIETNEARLDIRTKGFWIQGQ